MILRRTTAIVSTVNFTRNQNTETQNMDSEKIKCYSKLGDFSFLTV